MVTQLVSAEGSARHPGLPSHWQERKQHRQPPRALTWIQTRFPLWPSVTVLTHHCPAHLNLAVFVVSRMDLTHVLHGAFLPPASLNSCWCDLSGACSQPTRPLPEVPGLHSAPHHSQNRPVSARGHRQHVLRPSALSLQRGDQIPDHGSPHSSSPDGLGRLCPHQAGSPAPIPVASASLVAGSSPWPLRKPAWALVTAGGRRQLPPGLTLWGLHSVIASVVLICRQY